MELGTFTPPATGDSFAAQDNVDRPLIVVVREHRTGVRSQHKPEGGDAVVCDVVDLATGTIYLDVQWMSAAVADQLSRYVGHALPLKITWTPSKSGGKYLAPVALDGAELAAAQSWAQANPNAVELTRQQRQTQSGHTQPAQQQPTATSPTPANPGPGGIAQFAPAPLPTVTTSAAPPPAPAPGAGVPAAPASPTPAVDPNDPRIQALLAQIAAGQAPPAP